MENQIKWNDCAFPTTKGLLCAVKIIWAVLGIKTTSSNIRSLPHLPYTHQELSPNISTKFATVQKLSIDIYTYKYCSSVFFWIPTSQETEQVAHLTGASHLEIQVQSPALTPRLTRRCFHQYDSGPWTVLVKIWLAYMTPSYTFFPSEVSLLCHPEMSPSHTPAMKLLSDTSSQDQIIVTAVINQRGQLAFTSEIGFTYMKAH